MCKDDENAALLPICLVGWEYAGIKKDCIRTLSNWRSLYKVSNRIITSGVSYSNAVVNIISENIGTLLSRLHEIHCKYMPGRRRQIQNLQETVYF